MLLTDLETRRFGIYKFTEEVLSAIGGDQLHVMVADVSQSFDTIDKSILDRALERLGLPDWFLEANFSYHSQVRLWLKVAVVLGSHGVGMDVFLRVVLLAWWSLWLCMYHGVVILRLCLM